MKNIIGGPARVGRVLLTLAAAAALWPMQGMSHTCPANATATGVGVTVTALRTNGAPVGTGFVAPCEPIIIQMAIVYIPLDPITGGANAAFEDGTMLLNVKGVVSNVTPPGGVPLIGGDATVGCDGEAFFRSLQLPYTVTPADAIAGTIPILAIYTNGNAHIGEGNLQGVVSGTQGFVVNVRPNVTCSIAPQATNICQGSSASFTASAVNGTGPYTFQWTGPNGFSASGPTITINNAQQADAGTYRAVVTDFFGCTNVCTAQLAVRVCEVNIVLTKEIVCWTPDGCAPFTGSDTAVGVRAGTQCPSFCYRITVRNVTPGAEIRNLVVQDNELSLAGCGFPSILTAPGTPGASFSCIISNVAHCENVDNIVTVNGSGFDVVTGGLIGSVSTNDTARAVVVPISVVCEKTVSSPDDLDAGPAVLLPADNLPHAVTYGVTVGNPSTLPLVVRISDPALQNCPLPPEFATGVAIPAGQSITFSNICTAMLQCGVEPLVDDLLNTILVTAVVDTTLTNICPFAHDGSLVVASSDCSALVQCRVPAGAGCTPGFWKNCTIHWTVTGLTTGQRLDSVFNFGTCCGNLGDVSLRRALDFDGGDGVCGAARILLRAAVAALLNASSPEVNYPFARDEVIAQVNAALATCRRGPMITLAGDLDRANNLGCRDENGNSLPCKRLTIP